MLCLAEVVKTKKIQIENKKQVGKLKDTITIFKLIEEEKEALGRYVCETGI